MTIRKELRDRVFGILSASPHFTGFTERRAWAYASDVSSLPAFGVATPLIPVAAVTKDTSEHRVQLVVTIKRPGGDDLEDILDQDAEVVEVLVLTVLTGDGFIAAELSEIRLAIDAQGDRRVGTLTMTFTAVFHTVLTYPEE